MKKINWEDEPSTNTPLNADNLNLMQNNAEEAIDGHILFESEEGILPSNRITLNDDCNNYDYIEIFYKEALDNYWQSTKVFNPNNKNVALIVNRVGATSLHVHVADIAFGDNVIVWGNYLHMAFTEGGINVFEHNREPGKNIKICKVIGYKK